MKWESQRGLYWRHKCGSGEGKLRVGMVVCWNLMVLINDGTPCSNPADCCLLYQISIYYVLFFLVCLSLSFFLSNDLACVWFLVGDEIFKLKLVYFSKILLTFQKKIKIEMKKYSLIGVKLKYQTKLMIKRNLSLAS